MTRRESLSSPRSRLSKRGIFQKIAGAASQSLKSCLSPSKNERDEVHLAGQIALQDVTNRLTKAQIDEVV